MAGEMLLNHHPMYGIIVLIATTIINHYYYHLHHLTIRRQAAGKPLAAFLLSTQGASSLAAIFNHDHP